MDITLSDMDGKKLGVKSLSDSVFSFPQKMGAVYEAIKNENANVRAGFHKVKNRGEVRGGGSKPWRQKGTGRARQGSNTAPHWRGGGIVFGPSLREYTYKIPTKMKHAAVKTILSRKASEGDILIVKNLKLEKHSTKNIVKMVKDLKWDTRKKVTIVLGGDDEVLKKSIKNIEKINCLIASRLSARGLLYNHGLILTEEACELIEKQYGN